jgi:probable F420-dependent oxidoreductase
MKIGVVFPQNEFGNDPAALKDYAQTVEGLGFSHILTYDHVLGANPNRPGGWSGTYSSDDPFHEVFVLFSFLAAVTEKIEFATGILILPQRQTALVAKQAAALDVLSGGRLRLGVGLGWNEVEYVTLNEDFSNRGKRVEEQIDLLRKLWATPLVTYEGKWHSIPDAGLNPMPVQQPIPIWFGGDHENVLRRVGTIGDGWMPRHRTAEEALSNLAKIRAYAEKAGRDLAEIGLEPRLDYADGDPDTWRDLLGGWQDAGATHASIITMNKGFDTPAKHMQAIRTFAESMKIQ